MTTVDTTHSIHSLEISEVCALTSGAGWWRTKELPAAGIPSVLMADGPHGIRFQGDDDASDNLGMHESAPATCFPPGVALASTWSPDLARRVGAALASEARRHGIGVVLGPGINLKRSPLGGRNFEYFSEDPHLTGVLGSAWVQGLQSGGVGASLKHFAVNNQETRRMTVDAQVAERPLRELYLRAFERVVREARPWTVMSAYNKVNGEWASQNRQLLTGILREKWGFDGLVVSDWGAVVDRVAAIEAGLDLEMPSAQDASTQALIEAVAEGRLAESHVRRAAARVAELARKVEAAAPEVDTGDHHALAREVAANAIVLLRNDAVGDGPLLPLPTGGTVALIGELARTPRYQGSGSSRVVPTRVETPLQAMTAALGDRVRFAPGYDLRHDAGRYATGGHAPTDESRTGELRMDASAAAAAADTAVVFLGLPGHAESEGYDRTDLELPADQLELLAAVRAVTDRVVVVLTHGSAVRVDGWSDGVPALVDASLLGQAGGAALADVLTGVISPSGKLAETLPLRLEDTPTFLDFPGDGDRVTYSEGIYVGYRWYDARRMPVAFPFGHGLSYTTFAYDDLAVRATADGGLVVTVSITNTGDVAGREVVQVYDRPLASRVSRPPRELRGFGSVQLAAGETRTVRIAVDAADLAYWDVDTHGWCVEPGEYLVEVGSSSRDIRVSVTVGVAGGGRSVRAIPLGPASTIRDWISDAHAGPRMHDAITSLAAAAGAGVPQPGSPAWDMLLDLRLAQVPQLRPDLVSAGDLARLMHGLAGATSAESAS